MAEVAPKNQITWKGESEEVKETTNELYIIFALGLLDCLFSNGCYI